VPILLQNAFDAVLHSKLASDTTAAAALASAVSSLTKRTVQLIKAAAALQAQSSQAALRMVAAACFPAAVSVLVGHYMLELNILIFQAIPAESRATAKHGNGVSQASASAALLVVVLARSLVQLADAMEAAGPPVLRVSSAQPILHAVVGV
jgi:hypothetical protein